MDIISAYREVGSYRGAAAVCGTTHETVRRVIAAHEVSEARNYDGLADLVTERVKATKGRISAKRLLPARTAGFTGSAGTSAGWSPMRRRRGGVNTAVGVARFPGIFHRMAGQSGSEI